MSDSIVNCTVCKDLTGVIQYYEVTFSFDGLNVPLRDNPTHIWANTLTDATDLIEVKKAACQRAKELKIFYSSLISIDDLNGPVSL